MEDSYETFEEELGPPQASLPVRQSHRPEMYTTRKIKEESAPAAQPPPQPVSKVQPREPSLPRTMSLRKSMSIQNLTLTETPWENVTLNRCLFVAITLLVLTSGCQRLHETLRGQKPVEEEEYGLTVRRSGGLRHKAQLPEPTTSIWEVIFWWLPEFDDEEDNDEDGGTKRGKAKRGAAEGASRGLRNRPQPGKTLTKQRAGTLKDRRAKKDRDDETRDPKNDKEKRGKQREAEEEENEDEEKDEGAATMTSKKLKEKKEKKQAHKP